MNGQLFGITLASVLLAAFGQTLMRQGAKGTVTYWDYVNWSVATGLGFYVFSTVLWLILLRKIPLNILFPFTALTLILVMVFARFFLGEQFFTLWHWAGFALILGGLACIWKAGVA